MIRVLLVDDSESFRAGLALLLGTAPDVEVVGECDDGRNALAAVRRLRPHVVLMDLDMPGTNGIDATAELIAAEPGVPVVILTGSVRGHAVEFARRAGARGFLLKGVDPDLLIWAVRSTAAGGWAWSPDALGWLSQPD